MIGYLEKYFYNGTHSQRSYVLRLNIESITIYMVSWGTKLTLKELTTNGEVRPQTTLSSSNSMAYIGWFYLSKSNHERE